MPSGAGRSELARHMLSSRYLRIRFWSSLPPIAVCLTLAGCSSTDDGDVDTPELVWANPDSVRVGDVTTAHALGCPDGWSICAGTVRGLRWASGDTLVLRFEPRNAAGSSATVRGVRVGSAWAIAIAPGGRDSALVRVIP